MEKCIYSQPKINIGLLGQVASGKTVTVKAFTGVETFKFAKKKKKELL